MNSILQKSSLIALCVLVFLANTCGSVTGQQMLKTPILSQRNLEAPFPYVFGASRSWPVFQNQLPPQSRLELTARQDGRIRAKGTLLSFKGITVSLSDTGYLEVVSDASGSKMSFQLQVTLSLPDGSSETQELQIRPAPPDRPISYIADFWDDMLRIFSAGATDKHRDIEKTGFDQYFRRMQAHGINRLIVFLGPFPYIADPNNYPADDWHTYENQAQAILRSSELSAALKKDPAQTWQSLKLILAMRQLPHLGAMISQSAGEHGISLTVSFRPFETAASKYYAVPTFDSEGDFLWMFSPFATPLINYHPEKACFAHYRTILAKMGFHDLSQIHTIEIPNVENPVNFIQRFKPHGDNLKIVACDFPPIQPDSFILHRQSDGSFVLKPYREIQPLAESRLHTIANYDIEYSNNSVYLTNLDIPDEYRFILLTNPAGAQEALVFPTERPVVLRSKSATPLGREHVYWALDDSSTQIGGITAQGGFNSIFFASQASRKVMAASGGQTRLINNTLVIDRGSPYSMEMLDFNNVAARNNAIAEVKTLLSYPAFDEILLNTRSHIELPSYLADGEMGIEPIISYELQKKKVVYPYLGIGLGYAPLTVGDSEQLRALASDHDSVAQITTFQPGEWRNSVTCQSPQSPFTWRYLRNLETAVGVRKLLIDFEKEFPGVRIRAVIPEREEATQRIRQKVNNMARPEGGMYDSNYSLYGISAIGVNFSTCVSEGMAMLDLTGLSVEPVFSGIRYLPDQKPLEVFVGECIADMAGNHGSNFSGPRSFFYEGHEVLYTTFSSSVIKAVDQPAAHERMEQIMCYLLSQTQDINEIILYEAADWLYYIPLTDPDRCGRSFLDRCQDCPSKP